MKKDIHLIITTAWFSLLEQSILIGTVKFLGDKSDNTILKILFYLSWYFFYMNIIIKLESVDHNYLPSRYKKHQKNFNLIINGFLGIIISFFMFIVIINTVETFN